jgi:hypothetical protein
MPDLTESDEKSCSWIVEPRQCLGCTALSCNQSTVLQFRVIFKSSNLQIKKSLFLIPNILTYG